MTETDVANLALAKLGEPLIADINDTEQKGARLAKLLLAPTRQHLLRLHFWAFASRVVTISPQPADTIRVTGTLATVGSNGLPSPVVFPPLRLYGTVNSRAAYRDSESTAAAPAPFSLYNDGAKWVLTGRSAAGTTATWNAAAGTQSDVTLSDFDPSAVSPATGVPVLTIEKDAELVGFDVAFRKPTSALKIFRLLDSTGNKIERYTIRRVNEVVCILTKEIDFLSLQFTQDIVNVDDWDPLFLEAFTTLLASKIARPLTGKATMENRLLAQFNQIDLPNARTMDAYDLNSNENHPLREFLNGSLTRGTRGDFYGENGNEA